MSEESINTTPITELDPSCGHHVCWGCGACPECDMCDCFWAVPYAPSSGAGITNAWIEYGRTFAERERGGLKLLLNRAIHLVRVDQSLGRAWLRDVHEMLGPDNA